MQISIGFFLHLRGNDTYNEGDDKQNCTTISSLHTYYLAGVEISQNWIQILILWAMMWLETDYCGVKIDQNRLLYIIFLPVVTFKT